MADPKLVVRLEANTEKWKPKLVTAANDADATLAKIGQSFNKAGGDVGKSLGAMVNGGGGLGAINNLKGGIGSLGSSLAAAGAAGLAAGAAFSVLAVGMGQALKAADFADELSDTAQTIGITTDRLQELDYIALKTGSSIAEMRDSLLTGNEALGKFQNNLGDAKVEAAMKALKITREDAAGWKTMDEGFDEISKGLQGMTAAQQAAIVKSLGLKGALNALRDGSFDQMAEDAHRLGFVMDKNLIAKAGELKGQMELATQVIDVQLMEAFVDLLPVITGLINGMATMARIAGDIANSFRSIENKTDRGLARDLEKQNAARNNAWRQAQHDSGGKARLDASGRMIGGGSAGTVFNDLTAKVLATQAEIAARSKKDAAAAAAAPKTNAQVVVVDKPKGGGSRGSGGTKTDNTIQFDEEATATYTRAQRDTAAAQVKLATSILERAGYERTVLEQERTDNLAELSKQERKIRESKNNSHKEEQLALIEKARLEVENKNLIDRQILARETTIQLLEEANDATQQDAELRARAYSREEDRLNALADLATTTAERTKFEAAALVVAQKREDDIAQAQVDRAAAELAVATALNDQAKIIAAQKNLGDAMANQQSVTESHSTQNAQFEKDHMTNGQKYLEDLRRSAETAFEDMKVNGIQAFNDEIVNAIMNTHDLGKAFSNVAKSIVADLVRIGVQRMITMPLADAIFGSGSGGGGGAGNAGGILSFASKLFGGHAAGTDHVTESGMYNVGEAGVETVFLPKGAQVVPNNILKNAFSKNSGMTPASGAVQVTNHIYANNSLVLKEIHEQIATASLQSIQAARQATKADIGRSNQNNLVRGR